MSDESTTEKQEETPEEVERGESGANPRSPHILKELPKHPRPKIN